MNVTLGRLDNLNPSTGFRNFVHLPVSVASPLNYITLTITTLFEILDVSFEVHTEEVRGAAHCSYLEISISPKFSEKSDDFLDLTLAQ